MNNFSDAYISKAIEYAKSQVQKLTEQVIVWDKELLYDNIHGQKYPCYPNTTDSGMCDIAILDSSSLHDLQPCLFLYKDFKIGRLCDSNKYLSISVYSGYKTQTGIICKDSKYSRLIYRIDLADGFIPTGKEVFVPLDFDKFKDIDVVYKEVDGKKEPFSEGVLAYVEITHLKGKTSKMYSYKYFQDVNYSSVSEFKY